MTNNIKFWINLAIVEKIYIHDFKTSKDVVHFPDSRLYVDFFPFPS